MPISRALCRGDENGGKAFDCPFLSVKTIAKAPRIPSNYDADVVTITSSRLARTAWRQGPLFVARPHSADESSTMRRVRSTVDG